MTQSPLQEAIARFENMAQTETATFRKAHWIAAAEHLKLFLPKEREFVGENFNAGYQLSEHKAGKGIERPTLTEYLNQLYPEK